VWRGVVGEAYRLPTLSFVGASLAPPCFRFHTPLIEPDVQIYIPHQVCSSTLDALCGLPSYVASGL
jgi:hypothetical protein